jgi:hypothetical protein
MKTQLSRIVVTALLAALFFGTLMPGGWKDAALDPLHSPLDLAATAHVVLFAAIIFMLPPARLWNVEHWQLPPLGLALALLTEGLQFFAIDRHPNLAGVAQDMLGALVGWLLLRRLGALRWKAAAHPPDPR